MGGKGVADLEISAREREVLALLGEHLTNQEISTRLYISVRTVESHVSALLRKLAVADRRALAGLARSLPQQGGEPQATARTQLPSPLTPFVGRAAERAALAAALAESRLVTAVGPGGVGKTRLALAVTGDLSAQFLDGAWYVDLVPVTDPGMVAPAVAAALGLGEHPQLTPEQAITNLLADRESLLVLDNCEHVVDGTVPFVERLLTDCRTLVVLATSRARLVVPFERVFPVPGLAVADSGDGGDAVALFRERAGLEGQLTSDEHRHVVAICRALDGMALAIELAAARLPTLGLDGLESALADRMRLLTGGRRADDRHRSLRTTLDWSYALLDAAERAALRQTSVFAAPFPADAAALIIDPESTPPDDVADILARLADQSLLTVVTGGAGTRYRMLETIRQYGGEQLVAEGERDAVRSRHLEWCLSAARRCDRDREADRPDWRTAFDDVVDELRAALAWVSDVPALPAEAHPLARLLGEVLFARGLPTEAQRRIEQAAAFGDGDAKVEALELAADIALCGRNGDDIFRLRCAAADAADRVGNRPAVALNLARAVEAVRRFRGLFSASMPTREQLDALRARAGELAGDDALAGAALVLADACAVLDDPTGDHTDELVNKALVLAEASGEPSLESSALDQVTAVELVRGDILAANASAHRRLEVLGQPPYAPGIAGEVNDATHMAAMTSVAIGDLADAEQLARRRIELSFYSEENDLAADWLIIVAALVGELDEAVAVSRRFRAGWERAGRPSLAGFSAAPYAAAMAHGLRGEDAARAEWLDIHAAFRRTLVSAGMVPSATEGTHYVEWFDAVNHLHAGDAEAAVAALAPDPESFVTWNTAVFRSWYAALWAEAAVLAGLPVASDRIARAGPLAGGNPVAAAIVARADALLGNQPTELDAAAGALLATGCRYQWARTLVLAGGDQRTEGERAMAAMGATPMIVG